MELRDLHDRAVELRMQSQFMTIPQADFDRLCAKHPDQVWNVDRDQLEPVRALSVGFNWFAIPGEIPAQHAGSEV